MTFHDMTRGNELVLTGDEMIITWYDMRKWIGDKGNDMIMTLHERTSHLERNWW